MLSGSYFHCWAVEVDDGMSNISSSSSSSGGGKLGPGEEERFAFLRGAVALEAGRFLFLDFEGASESSETTKSERLSATNS